MAKQDEQFDRMLRDAIAESILRRVPLSRLFDRRITKGGWFIDAEHSLPKRDPTAEQMRTYKSALLAWNKKQKTAADFLKNVQKSAARLGLVVPEEDGEGNPTIYPSGEVPHCPVPLEYVKTDLDRAVAEYRLTGSENALRRASKLGCRIIYGFNGFSASRIDSDIFLLDGPKAPIGISLKKRG